MKTLSSLHVYIFLYDFEVHYMVFRNKVCLKEYMDLSPRLINGTKSEHTESMRRTKKSESIKIIIIITSYTPQYSRIQNWLQPCSYKGFTYFYIFTILEVL